MRNLKIITVFLALANVAVISSLAQTTNSTELNNAKLQCQRQIRSAAYCVFQYQGDHDGQFPKTLAEAVEEESGKQMATLLTRCPETTGAKYNYVDWSNWFTNGNVPKQYPVVYESKIGHHGNGINVALMDGSAFWDENAMWINDFSKKHPNYKIELPKESVNGSVPTIDVNKKK